MVLEARGGKTRETERRHDQAKLGRGAGGEQELTLGTVCIFAEGSSSTRRESKGRPCAREGGRGELLSWEVTREWASFSQDMVDRDYAHAFRDLDGMRVWASGGAFRAVDVGWSARWEGEGPAANERLRGRFSFALRRGGCLTRLVGGGPQKSSDLDGKDTRGWGRGKRREGENAERQTLPFQECELENNKRAHAPRNTWKGQSG